MKKLFFAALAVVLFAGTASAAVQNVKVSGSVDSTYIDRKSFDLGGDVGEQKQGVFITQTTLRVDADLTDNVSATVRLLNERAWEDGPDANAAQIDINLAFVTLREFLYSPLTLTVGRQEFLFGNGFIFDSAAAGGRSDISGIASDLSKRFAVDAIRATLDYNPLTLDLVYLRRTQEAGGAFRTGGDKNAENTDVYGINANYALGDDMGSVLETYYWKRWNRADSNTGSDQEDKLHIYGVRASTNPLEGVSTSIEYAHQSGESDNGSQRNKNANAVQFVTSYQVPVLEEYNPILTYSFTKYSGDVSQGSPDNRDSGWDSFYNDQLEGIVYNLFSKTNLVVHDLYLETTPLEDVTAGVRWQGLWLDKAYEDGTDPTYTLNDSVGGTASFNQDETDEDESYLGSEFDFNLTYDYTEDVQIGTTLGYFFPGDFFTDQADAVAKQWLVNLNVAF